MSSAGPQLSAGRPVIIAKRDGAQTGAAEKQFCQRTPSWARRSMTGVAAIPP